MAFPWECRLLSGSLGYQNIFLVLSEKLRCSKREKESGGEEYIFGLFKDEYSVFYSFSIYIRAIF